MCAIAAVYDAPMSEVEHLREAVKRHRIEPRAIADRLGVTPKAVWTQLDRARVAEWNLARYADAMTAVLHERGDMRRFTVASLQAGPDPEPVPAVRTDTLADAVAELAARGLAVVPLEKAAQTLVPVGPATMRRVPCYGAVPCGAPLRLGDEPDMIELLTMQLPSGWHDGCYILRASGRSMEALGIHDGDWLAIDPNAEPVSGRPVIATLNGETTCKLLRRGSEGSWLLESTSADFPPIIATARDELHIQGVVMLVIPAPFEPWSRRRR